MKTRDKTNELQDGTTKRIAFGVPCVSRGMTHCSLVLKCPLACCHPAIYLFSLLTLIFTSPLVAQSAKSVPSPIPVRPLFVPPPVETISATSKAIGAVFLVQNWEDSIPTTTVTRVVSGASADLVLLKDGYRQNFCPGMICLVGGHGQPSGTALVIAEADAGNAVALVVEQVLGATLKAGDSVRIKTVQFSR